MHKFLFAIGVLLLLPAVLLAVSVFIFLFTGTFFYPHKGDEILFAFLATFMFTMPGAFLITELYEKNKGDFSKLLPIFSLSMSKTKIVLLTLLAVIVITAINLFTGAISFSNTVKQLVNLKQAEVETLKVSYSQCLTKILETNSVARAYADDVRALAAQGTQSLNSFENQLSTMVWSKILPELSPNLRENVQREIVTCRNAFVNRIDESIKPIFIQYNNTIEMYPGLLYNMYFQYKREDLSLPKTDVITNTFNSGVDKELELK